MFEEIFEKLERKIEDHKKEFPDSRLRLERSDFDAVVEHHRDGAYHYEEFVLHEMAIERLMLGEGLSFEEAKASVAASI